MNFYTLAGIYTYAMDFHTGQWSRLYRLMSKIQFHAQDHVFDAIRRGRDDPNNEWEAARIVYRKLKRRQAQ